MVVKSPVVMLLVYNSHVLAGAVVGKVLNTIDTSSPNNGNNII